MRVLACAKQVPDPEGVVRLDPVTRRVDRSGRLVLDPADAVGVEAALRVGADEVVLASVGPGRDLGGLRSGLAMGASRAVLVADDRLAGVDSLGTAMVLAAVVHREGPFDLVIAGTESSDGYTGVLPMQLAAVLDLPAVTFARSLDIADGALRAERQLEDGIEDVECALPCVVTVTSGAVAPRYPSYKAIVGARSKVVDVLSLEDVGVAAPEVAQEVLEVVAAPARVGGEVVDDDGLGHVRVLDLLVRLKVL